MTAAIHRGQVLREILKQDRLAPLPAVFDIAWLVAFNDGHFDKVEPEAVRSLLEQLENEVNRSALDLESPRELWSDAVTEWLSSALPGDAQ